MYHYRKSRNEYARYPKPKDCPFCDAQETGQRILRETEHALVIPNRTFYDVWETRSVLDHLLVIPKRHVKSLSELSDAEKLDIVTLIGDYEKGDYSMYARAGTSVTRSVGHQHTHLIKTDAKMAKFYLHIKKPYLTVKF